MALVDSLIKKRSNIKGSLTKLYNYANALTVTEGDYEQIKVRLRRAENLLTEFGEVEDAIFRVKCEEASQLDDFEDKYYSTIATLNKWLRKTGLTAGHNISVDLEETGVNTVKMGNVDVKLPKIQIPTFSGDYTEWQSFYDLFSSTIHENLSLNPAQKFQYLKGLLRGEAAALLKHLTVSDANYIEAMSKLKKRYDRKKHIIQTFIKTFMEIPTIQNPTAQNIKRIMDTADEVIRGLKAIGTEAEGRDPWLIYILLQKLDDETKEKWANESVDTDIPNCDMLLEFLMKRADAFDSVRSYTKRMPNLVKPNARTLLSTPGSCPLCEGNSHLLYQCNKFKEMNISERREWVKNNNRCFNCFSRAHTVYKCTSKAKCHHCGKRHHSLVHITDVQNIKADVNNSLLVNGQQEVTPSSSIQCTSNNSEPLNSICAHINNEFHLALLPTALVKIADISGQYYNCRALLDSGSQTSIISETCAQKLGLQKRNGRISIQGLASQGAITTKGITSFTIKPHFKSTFELPIIAYVIPFITSTRPILDSTAISCNDFNNRPLADPSIRSATKIDLLIGADKFFELLKEEKLYDDQGTVFAQNTYLGWVLTGNTNLESISSCNTVTNIESNNNIDLALKRFWETEEINSGHIKPIPEHEYCEELFTTTTRRTKDGRYEVRLPFKPKPVNLGDSRNICLKRLYGLEQKFNKDKKLCEMYHLFMNEYLKLNHMKEVETPIDLQGFTYLPHHGVLKESSTTTKLRVVFDASAKCASGFSLNDHLIVGPTIQNPLADILIRFRLFHTVFTADAEKMYRQILVNTDDRKFQRILWRTNRTEPVKNFELQTLTYGMSSAPYLATRVLKQIAMDNREQFPRATSIIERDMYMDDLLTGANTLEEAIQLGKEITQIMKESGLLLRKWASNSSEFLRHFQQIDGSAEEIATKPLDEHPDTIKILGLQWLPNEDAFTYQVRLNSNPPLTKRAILSEASRIFDPLGLISPFVIKIKCMFQGLWLLQLTWDEPLPKEPMEKWLNIRREINDVIQITIPRWLNSTESDFQLHGFCDASELAYAAVVYLRSHENGVITTKIITAKTKVAPIKNVSLPRLELNGALLLAKLIDKIKSVLKVSEPHIFIWTDSTIVLDWLSAPPRKWKTYIANRTSQILELTERICWRHVSTQQNPADCATRGLSPQELKKHQLWWNGPEFLRYEETKWPKHQPSNSQTNLEQRSSLQVMIATRPILHNCLINDLINKYETYDKIIRVFTIVRSFLSLCKKNREKYKSITVAELKGAEAEVIKHCQNIYYLEEVAALSINQPVSSKSSLKSLNPFLDQRGIMRVGGRIEQAIAPYDTRHPIIVSHQSMLSTKLIQKYHKVHLHCGASLLLSILRRRFWITKAKQIIKATIRNCVQCIKQRPKPAQQLMGMLPKERVELIRPFLKIGIDFAGPIKSYLKRGRGQKTHKFYICLIICMSTKAIHLEVVGDLTTDSVLAALKRFFARRGVCTDIFSDNGTNFKGACNRLKELNLFLKNNINIISDSILKLYTVNWHFIPPRAPHFGGIWEAGVKSAKTHMERVIGSNILTLEELQTLLVQIEGLLNSRPLCQLSSDEPDALTPAHFLIGHAITTLPQPTITEVPYNRLSHWESIQKMLQLFWKRWRREYLTSLQVRTKWTTEQANLNVEDVVLILEDNALLNQWTIGRITDVYAGTDNKVRVAKIYTKYGEIRRPITKLCRLPIN